MKKLNINESHIIFSFFNRVVRITGVLVDVGAHIGNSIRPFADDGWDVHAFEPEENNFKDLYNNYSSYKNVKTNKLAVSDIDGVVKFFVSSKYWGIHSLKPFHKSHNKVVELKSISLRKYIKMEGLKKIDFLKIDTEGADLNVLRGAGFDLVRPQVVMVEYMDSRSKKYFGYDHHDMAKFLQDKGYVVFMFNWSKIIGGYSEKGISKSTTGFVNFEKYPSKKQLFWGNLVAMKKKMSLPFYVYIKMVLFMNRIKSIIIK